MLKYRQKLGLPEQTETPDIETMERPKAFEFEQGEDSVLEHECIERANGKLVCGICGRDWPCPGGYAVKLQ